MLEVEPRALYMPLNPIPHPLDFISDLSSFSPESIISKICKSVPCRFCKCVLHISKFGSKSICSNALFLEITKIYRGKVETFLNVWVHVHVLYSCMCTCLSVKVRGQSQMSSSCILCTSFETGSFSLVWSTQLGKPGWPLSLRGPPVSSSPANQWASPHLFLYIALKNLGSHACEANAFSTEPSPSAPNSNYGRILRH